MIVNQTNSIPIMVKIYPVGAIFSAGGQYTCDASNAINQQNKFLYPIEQIVIDYDQNGYNYYTKANFVFFSPEN